METSLNLDNKSNLLIEQKIRKLGNFSRIIGYLYLIITIIPTLIFSSANFLLKPTTKTVYSSREIISRNIGFNNDDIGNLLEPFLPVLIFGFISFIILSVLLICLSNQIIKYCNQEINKRLNNILIISILILIILSPLLISILSPLVILDIKIIFDIFEIKNIRYTNK